ncbi:hypothetical protein KAT80_01535 [Candidatus Pacearchaeota archaeon]|nr:hypothetical protein [Candidatus Pacearchaeota archaeon]
MEKENYGFSDSELTILRRLWEIRKEQFLDSNSLSAKKYLSSWQNTKLWKKFRLEGSRNLFRRGSPDNIISAHEEILYPLEWVSPSFEIKDSPFDRDAFRRYNH